MARRTGDFGNVEPLFPRDRPPGLGAFTPSRGTRRLLWVAGILVLFFVVARPAVGFYTDLLWFRSLDLPQLFLTRFQYQGWIFVATLLVAFGALASSSMYAVRQVNFSALLAIGVRRSVASAGIGRAVLAVSLIVAAIMAAVASAAWETVAAAANGVSFNRTDPLFGQDIGFYVFQLPAYRLAWLWLMALLLICALVAGFAYLSTRRGIDIQPRGVTHLSLLGVAFFILLAVHYRLAMFDLLLSSHGYVYGAGYVDVNVRLPVYWFLLVVSLVLAVAMLANALWRRPALLVGAPSAWLILVLILLGAVPPIVQRFAVNPSELSQERPYIQREIDATNLAYGLDRITFSDFAAREQLAPDVLSRNSGTISNVRLWDYGPLQTAYNQLQTIRTYYDFHRVAIDRYTLDSGYHQMMLSARELNTDKLPDTSKSWLNIHLKYTHGYGAAATQVSKVADAEGRPDLTLSNIPPVGQPAITTPQVYFGELTQDWVVVGGNEQEVDYEKGDNPVYSHWTGTHGVRLDDGLARSAFAYQLGDLNLAISGQVTANSQLLYRRSIQDRLQTLTPFINYDPDPYLVVEGGKQYWIADGYTVTDSYPYSEQYTDGSGNGYNYIRNSVKAVIDAYEGTVTFYDADPADPVLATYMRIFPGTFHPLREMPTGLRNHLRYPEQLFTTQAQKLEVFHMHDPQVFYGRTDAWAQPNEVKDQGGAAQPLEPYYVVMRLPGMQHEEFVLIQPFTPLKRTNMIAWIAARSDGDAYGNVVGFKFPTNRQVVGPEQVDARIDQDPTISAQLTLLNSNGSSVKRGNLLVIPVEDTILFVKPIYLLSSGASAIPELRKVVVADEQRVAWADTLDGALQALTTGQATTTTTTTGTPGGPPATLADLVSRAQSLYKDAQAKLKAGDFAGYAKDIEELGPILDQVGAAAPSPGGKPSPSPSP